MLTHINDIHLSVFITIYRSIIGFVDIYDNVLNNSKTLRTSYRRLLNTNKYDNIVARISNKLAVTRSY